MRRRGSHGVLQRLKIKRTCPSTGFSNFKKEKKKPPTSLPANPGSKNKSKKGCEIFVLQKECGAVSHWQVVRK
jgi:hypothetical protein